MKKCLFSIFGFRCKQGLDEGEEIMGLGRLSRDLLFVRRSLNSLVDITSSTSDGLQSTPAKKAGVKINNTT